MLITTNNSYKYNTNFDFDNYLVKGSRPTPDVGGYFNCPGGTIGTFGANVGFGFFAFFCLGCGDVFYRLPDSVAVMQCLCAGQ